MLFGTVCLPNPLAFLLLFFYCAFSLVMLRYKHKCFLYSDIPLTNCLLELKYFKVTRGLPAVAESQILADCGQCH